MGDEGEHDYADTIRMRSEYRDWRDYVLKRPSSRFESTAINQSRAHKDRYLVWRNLVKEFQGRRITKEGDRLSAIGGLAYAFNGASRDEYYAGIWRSDIHHGLLWAVKPNRRGLPYRPARSALPDTEHHIAPCQPPSWSWASTAHSIFYPRTDLSNFLQWDDAIRLTHELCTIEDIQLNFLTSNDFGQVNGGILQLRGPFQWVRRSNINSLTTRPNDIEWWLDDGTYGRSDFKDWQDFGCVLVGINGTCPVGLVLSKVTESAFYCRTGVVQFPYVECQEPWDWLDAWDKDHSITIV